MTACSSSSSDTTTAATDAVETTAVATDAAVETTVAADTTAAAEPTGANTGTLTALTNGDAACYVELTTDGGPVSLPGSFELCAGGGSDATALIGQTVNYTTEKANILAASCEGDVDCGKSDEVDLVMTITAADGAPATPLDSAQDDVDDIEGLPLGLSANDIQAALGAPTSKSDIVEEGATGEFVSTWTWDKAGVSAKMSAVAEDLDPNLGTITIKAPSTLKTKKGIGIGATADEVLTTYGAAVNEQETTVDSIVVGSMFGGVIFSIDGNGIVTEIFVGAAAE